jgi:hypothetical protein
VTTKNIKEIISIQNYCKDIIQELYTYESRPYDLLSKNIINITKLEEAIRLEIIEYDSFDDELSLSVDTEEYYRARLGQNSETNIGEVGDKLHKLENLLKDYSVRQRAKENATKEIKSIYKLLNKIPSIFKHNLQALSSTTVFTFKNEPNFEIKMNNLKRCKEEISQLSDALKEVDRVMDEQWSFFRGMDDRKINFAINKIKRNSADFERSFAQLHDDILHFINQSIQDGAFIKRLKKLKQLKSDHTLIKNTNIEDLVAKRETIFPKIKENKILPEDKMYAYVEQIQEILKARKNVIVNTKEATAIDYDIHENIKVSKKLYNYPKIHREFLNQERDLISFLLNYPLKIEEEKLMGVFVRLIKNYADEYKIEDEVDDFIQIEDRLFLKVYSPKIGIKSVN